MASRRGSRGDLHRTARRLGRGAIAIVAIAALVDVAAAAGGPRKAPTTERAPATAPQPALEPKAVELMKGTGARLAAARTMRFTATVGYENPSVHGLPLLYTTRSEVTLQRPDKLRVVTSGDGPASEFYYDGKSMSAFEPAAKLVAVADAPSTIDEALKAAYQSAAIYFPFSDFVVSDPYGDISDGLLYAYYIGQSRIVGGTTTEMVAFATPHVFAQMWIGADDRLPRMIRAVYRDDRLQLRHELQLSDWQLDLAIPEDTFRSAAAATATRIEFARPDPPPGKGTPAAPKKRSRAKKK